MDDLISRQAAIDTFNGEKFDEAFCNEYEDGYNDGIDFAVSTLSFLPSAQPEQKTGWWEMKPDPYGFFEEIPVCSECGCTTEMRKTYNYCPNCGADMREEDNDET